jgi:hypothetical protein
LQRVRQEESFKTRERFSNLQKIDAMEKKKKSNLRKIDAMENGPIMGI